MKTLFSFLLIVIPSEVKSRDGTSAESRAMTLFFFQILVFCFEVVHISVPDANQVAKKLKVSHFDRDAMTENTLYALNQVRQCDITPEEISQMKIILYTKHFRKELNAT